MEGPLSRSSISSSEAVPAPAGPALHRRSKAPASILVAVALVVGAEIVLRIAAPHIPAVLEWDNWQTQNKVAAMDRLAAKGGASVVSVGSSMVNSGVDPKLLTELLGDKRPAFNAALDGSNIHLTELWTLKVVVPRLHPRVVVIGMNSAELNANGVDEFENLFANSLGWRRVSGDGSAFQHLKDDFERWSYLVRYRAVLRAPTQFFTKNIDRIRGGVGPLGTPAGLTTFQSTPYGIKPDLRALAAKIFYRYAVGADRVAALGRLVDGLTSQGIKVVLVRMPITADEIPFHPHGQADYDKFVTVLNAFVAGHPKMRYVDMMPLFPTTDYFRDPHHVNLKGKERLTHILAGILAKL